MYTVTYDRLMGVENYTAHHYNVAAFRSAVRTLRECGWTVTVHDSRTATAVRA